VNIICAELLRCLRMIFKSNIKIKAIAPDDYH